MALYMDDNGRVRDEDTGKFASMDAYLEQLTYEAYEFDEESGDDGEGEGDYFEEFESEGYEMDLDEFPDYDLDPGDEVEFTVDVAYEEGATS